MGPAPRIAIRAGRSTDTRRLPIDSERAQIDCRTLTAQELGHHKCRSRSENQPATKMARGDERIFQARKLAKIRRAIAAAGSQAGPRALDLGLSKLRQPFEREIQQLTHSLGRGAAIEADVFH